MVLIIEESQSVKNKISEFLNIFKNQNIDLSSIFPLKFYIRYIIDFNIIVIQLDNKNFFTTEEIISNLFGEDEGKLIFENPSNYKNILVEGEGGRRD